MFDINTGSEYSQNNLNANCFFPYIFNFFQLYFRWTRTETEPFHSPSILQFLRSMALRLISPRLTGKLCDYLICIPKDTNKRKSQFVIMQTEQTKDKNLDTTFSPKSIKIFQRYEDGGRGRNFDKRKFHQDFEIIRHVPQGI